MDLKLKDVAELLNVSETTVRRWISDGKIPYYRLNQQLRFSREEIETWLLSSRQEGEFSAFQDGSSLESHTMGTHQFGLFRAIYRGGVYSGISGEKKEEVIEAAMKQIGAHLSLDAEVLTGLLLDREALMPTALSNGVAVPHTRDFLLQESFDAVSVVFLEKPIEYGALDGQPVDLLFFLFACDDKRHLHLLAKLAYLSSKGEYLSFLRTRPSKAELLESIKKWEAELKIGRESVLVYTETT